MKKEFQELKNLYLMAQGRVKGCYLSQMRENLKKRNGNADLYTNHYTHQGKTINIDNCDYEELLEIDNDMVACGK